LQRAFLAAPVAILLTTTRADACLFVGIDPVTKEISSGVHSRGFGVNESGACRRAERKCLRKLKAAWNNTKVQQFTCKRIE
jgi:hypothetical protein